MLNKKFKKDYQEIKSFEAGIILMGEEVKAIRNNEISFSDSYVTIINSIPLLINFHIKNENKAEAFKASQNPKRERTLLLNKSEINYLKQKIQEEGLTIIPSEIYFVRNKVKLKISLCKGLKNYNKKKLLIEKDIKKLSEREMKNERKM